MAYEAGSRHTHTYFHCQWVKRTGDAGSEEVGGMATEAGSQGTRQADLDQENMRFSTGIWLASGSADKDSVDETTYPGELEQADPG